MITVTMHGRLGNHLWQYAVCRTIAEKKGYEYTWTSISKDCYLNNNNVFYSIMSLDSIGHLFTDKISVVKIDVEGYEHSVLSGAKATLEKHKPVIIVEIGVDNLEKVNKLLNEYNYFLCS
jgi:FkbM family methyltransferase